MEAAATEATGVKASTVKSAAETRVSASGVRAHHPSVIETTEGASADSRHCVRGKPRVAESSRPDLVVTETAMAERVMSVIEAKESRAVGHIRMMIKPHRMVMPVGVPVVPAPTKASEVSDSDSETEIQPW